MMKKIFSPYYTFLYSLLISRIGDALYTFAIPWISFELTQSALIMGSLYAVSVLPIVLFGPIVGVLVDRWDRKNLMLFSDILRAILISLIPIFHYVDILQVWHLYVISFCLTVLSLLFDVTVVTSIPNIINDSKNGKLTKANASFQLVNQLADIMGPILAGILIAMIGGFNILWLDVLSFVLTFFAILKLPKLGENIEKNNIRNILKDMKEGFNWLVKDRLNLSFSLQAMVGNFGYSAMYAVLMYYLLSSLHLDAKQISLNYALLGVGGLLGSFIVVPLEHVLRRGLIIPILLLMGTLGFTFAILSDFWLAPGIAIGIVMTCNVAWNTLVMTIRQESVPKLMLGRVLSFSRVFTRLAMPLGAMVGVFVADHYYAGGVFIVAAIAKGIEVIISLISPIRKL
ncbi:MFS transporter [Bacillus solimangrovi]|uniref:Macrolide transporter n=1 Tax=Bacillus solimangrovi TaxID=1305675 RepID=A0A1E5LK46_9BACI|nr:MFS transporter [Bacillus solimangrovi]OEH94441.1 macrolide transporter [Bacillus solimangrovi]